MTFVTSTRQLKKAARIILVGAPGVGKGTQTERLIQRFPQLSSISSGDLLRENVRNKTPLGQKAQSIMRSGSLVPDPLILDLILSELTSRNWLSTTTPPSEVVSALARENGTVSQRVSANPDPASSFILDGFPRTAQQASALDRLVPINLVAHLVTPPAIIIERIAGRWVHEPSGRVYNTTFNAPRIKGKDDVTGEPLMQREDDSEETWRKRLGKFEETSKGLLEHYGGNGILWRVEGKSSDEISPKLFEEVERRFA
ncbi:MAG: hypothetical protein Q9227_007290 [Pyrenula ochraceoflavens]